MNTLGRLGSYQKYENTRDNSLKNVHDLSIQTMKMNSGKRILKSYDAPNETERSTILQSKIIRKDNHENIKSAAVTELELAETSLVSLKDTFDSIKDNVLQGASDTLDATDRRNLGNRLRILGETVVKLANSKIGAKYLFSGIQSNLETVNLSPGAAFDTATYKKSNVDLGERKVTNLQSSVSLKSLFDTVAGSAQVNGVVANPTPINGSMALLIDDGNGNVIDTGNIIFAADNLASAIVKINAAFNAAGGVGSIAQAVPATPPLIGSVLSLNTALITGNSANGGASISIDGNNTSSLINLGLYQGTTYGTSSDIMKTLSAIESAYNSNDSAALRKAVVDLDANIDRIINARAELGTLSNQLKESLDVDNKEKADFRIEKSSIEDIPIAEAISQVTKAQATVDSSFNITSTILQQNIFDFLRF